MQGPPSQAMAPRQAPAAGVALFRERCAICHGDAGMGDGPAAKGLMVAPRRFSDAFWQDSVDDAHLATAILQGGFAVKKSSAMPAHPDLVDRVAALIAVVRSMRCPTGGVAIEALREDGVVVATFTADADAKGAGVVEVTRLPAGTVALVGRAAGRALPLCRIPVDASSPPRDASCGLELAAGPGQEPR